MGCFSWLKAVECAESTEGGYRNVYSDSPFKCLIPQEYGGGAVVDRSYQQYGYLGIKPNGDPKYDMYELLAIWNADTLVEDGVVSFEGELHKVPVKSLLKGVDWNNPLKEIDENTDYNRRLGIDIGCYDDQIDRLLYPLKLVDIEYFGDYEECNGVSYGDPDQGFYPVRWDGTNPDDDDWDEEDEDYYDEDDEYDEESEEDE